MTKQNTLIAVAAVFLAFGVYLLVKTVSRKSQEHLIASEAVSNGDMSRATEEPESILVRHSDADRDELLHSVHDQLALELTERAKFHLKQGDPREFVKRAYHEITPNLTRQFLDQDALPTLHTLLQDHDYTREWPQIAQTICFLSDDPASVPVILEYIRRPAHWKAGTRDEQLGCLGKIEALKWLGILGGREAQQALTQALTTDGASELCKEWIDGPLPKWAATPEEDVIGVIRGHAAIGLAHAQSVEGMQLVEKLYQTERINVPKMPFRSRYFELLSEAMSIDQLVESVGVEKYRGLLFTPEYDKMIEPFDREYRTWLR